MWIVKWRAKPEKRLSDAVHYYLSTTQTSKCAYFVLCPLSFVTFCWAYKWKSPQGCTTFISPPSITRHKPMPPRTCSSDRYESKAHSSDRTTGMFSARLLIVFCVLVHSYPCVCLPDSEASFYRFAEGPRSQDEQFDDDSDDSGDEDEIGRASCRERV